MMIRIGFGRIVSLMLTLMALVPSACGSWTGMRWYGHEWEDEYWVDGQWWSMPWNCAYLNYVSKGSTILLHAEWIEQDKPKGTCSYYAEYPSTATYKWGKDYGDGTQTVTFTGTGKVVFGALSTYSGSWGDSICFLVMSSCPSPYIDGADTILVGKDQQYRIGNYSEADHWSVTDHPELVRKTERDGQCTLKVASVPSSGYITLKGALWINDGWKYPSKKIYVKEVVPVGNLTIDWGQSRFVYDGQPKEPLVTVKDGATTLTKGTHYLVTYKNNVNVGTAMVIVQGLDLYGGEVSKEFAIVAPPVVSDAVAHPRYPWNGLVDVDFDLTCASGDEQIPLTMIVHDNAGGTNLPCRTVQVDGVTAEKIRVKRGHHRVTWDAAADLPDGFECDRVAVEVKVE